MHCCPSLTMMNLSLLEKGSLLRKCPLFQCSKAEVPKLLPAIPRSACDASLPSAWKKQTFNSRVSIHSHKAMLESAVSNADSTAVQRYFRAINDRDLVTLMLLFSNDCVLQDLAYDQPITGNQALLSFFKELIANLSDNLSFVLEDETQGDCDRVGVLWHLEVQDVGICLMQGVSFFGLAADGRINYIRQGPEHFVKMAHLAMSATGMAAPVLNNLAPAAQLYSIVTEAARNLVAPIAQPLTDIVSGNTNKADTEHSFYDVWDSFAPAPGVPSRPSDLNKFNTPVFSMMPPSNLADHSSRYFNDTPKIGRGLSGAAGNQMSEGKRHSQVLSATYTSTAAALDQARRSGEMTSTMSPGAISFDHLPRLQHSVAAGRQARGLTQAAAPTSQHSVQGIYASAQEAVGRRDASAAVVESFSHADLARALSQAGLVMTRPPVISTPGDQQGEDMDSIVYTVDVRVAKVAQKPTGQNAQQSSQSQARPMQEHVFTATVLGSRGEMLTPAQPAAQKAHVGTTIPTTEAVEGSDGRQIDTADVSLVKSSVEEQRVEQVPTSASNSAEPPVLALDTMTSDGGVATSAFERDAGSSATVSSHTSMPSAVATQAFNNAVPYLATPAEQRSESAVPESLVAISLNMTGLWAKDEAASDLSAFDRALDLLQISGVQKATAKLIDGLEITHKNDVFQVDMLTIIPQFKVSEKYPLDGKAFKMRRRDLRSGMGDAAAHLDEAGAVHTRCSWGNPIPGTLAEVYFSPQPGILHVTSTLYVGERSETMTLVYKHRHGNRSDLLKESEKRHGRSTDILRRFGFPL